MSALIRLLYVSRAKPDLQQQDIREILQISRSRNAALGITGVLCVGTSDFIQVLEGPEEQVSSYTQRSWMILATGIVRCSASPP